MELEDLEEDKRKKFIAIHIITNEYFPFDFIEKFCENYKCFSKQKCANTLKKTLKEYNYLRGKNIKSMTEQTDICLYFRSSRSQRYSEIKNGCGLNGTEGFQSQGCYDNCDGFNSDCNKYLSKEMLSK